MINFISGMRKVSEAMAAAISAEVTAKAAEDKSQD